MSRVCTECNKHGTCAKERKVASGKGWCSKFYQSRRALEADRDALRAELDGVRQANRVLDSAAKDAQSWAYQLQECRAELERTKVAMERVRRNHLRRMRREALDWADRMIWNPPATNEDRDWIRRNRPRLLGVAESCRAALERKADASSGASEQKGVSDA